MIPGLVDDLPKTLAVLKAFTTYFQLVNLAEDEQRTEILRQRTADAQATGVPGRESMAEAVARLRNEGLSAEEMRGVLRQRAGRHHVQRNGDRCGEDGNRCLSGMGLAAHLNPLPGHSDCLMRALTWQAQLLRFPAAK